MGEYYLGIDGGGTKTDAVIIDGEGHVLGAGIGGGSNTSFVTMRAAVNAFKKAIRQALREAGIAPSEIVCSGSTFASASQSAFAELGIGPAFHKCSEAGVAFERARVAERRGVVVTAGTGSSVAGFNGDKRCCIGGWGAVLGDDGSAYDIGRRGIRWALMSEDGRMPESALTQAVREYFGVDATWKAVHKSVGTRVNQALIAGFAVKVGEAAAAGDKAALEIVEQVGESIGEMAAYVGHRIFDSDDEFALVLAGGVFNLGQLILRPIRAVFSPQFARARIVIARMRPGEAAARLVMRKCQGGPDYAHI